VAARFGSNKKSSSFVRTISDEKPSKGFTYVQLFWTRENTPAYLSLVSKMFVLDAFVYTGQGTNTLAYIFLASMMFDLDVFVYTGQGKNTLAYIFLASMMFELDNFLYCERKKHSSLFVPTINDEEKSNKK